MPFKDVGYPLYPAPSNPTPPVDNSTPTPTVTTSTTVVAHGHALPVTGGDIGGLIFLGCGALIVGAIMARRKRT